MKDSSTVSGNRVKTHVDLRLKVTIDFECRRLHIDRCNRRMMRNLLQAYGDPTYIALESFSKDRVERFLEFHLAEIGCGHKHCRKLHLIYLISTLCCLRQEYRGISVGATHSLQEGFVIENVHRK